MKKAHQFVGHIERLDKLLEQGIADRDGNIGFDDGSSVSGEALDGIVKRIKEARR